jgi:hypothetical protein
MLTWRLRRRLSRKLLQMQGIRSQSLALGFEYDCISVSLLITSMIWCTYMASLMVCSPSPGEAVVMSDMLSRVRKIRCCDECLRLR